jgi:hypothetical protein
MGKIYHSIKLPIDVIECQSDCVGVAWSIAHSNGLLPQFLPFPLSFVILLNSCGDLCGGQINMANRLLVVRKFHDTPTSQTIDVIAKNMYTSIITHERVIHEFGQVGAITQKRQASLDVDAMIDVGFDPDGKRELGVHIVSGVDT